MKTSLDHEELSNSVYRNIFPQLADGEMIIECTKDEAIARYDHREGVDVILETVDGLRFTVQEKILTFSRSTMTFETRKNSGALGAWYYCTAQLYFTAYSRHYLDTGVPSFQDWMLINYTALRLADLRGELNGKWGMNENKTDGRKSEFRFIDFRDIPESCIVSRAQAEQLQFSF